MLRVVSVTTLIFVASFADVSSAQNTTSIDTIDIAIKNIKTSGE